MTTLHALRGQLSITEQLLSCILAGLKPVCIMSTAGLLDAMGRTVLDKERHPSLGQQTGIKADKTDGMRKLLTKGDVDRSTVVESVVVHPAQGKCESLARAAGDQLLTHMDEDGFPQVVACKVAQHQSQSKASLNKHVCLPQLRKSIQSDGKSVASLT